MSYGIEIINADDRIIIDSNYINFGLLSQSPSTATQNSAYPGLTGVSSTDLVLARAETDSSGLVAKRGGNWVDDGYFTQAANSFVYYVARETSSLLTPETSGYGFEVYTPTGNVAFSSNITKNFEIVVSGVFNAYEANVFSITFPSDTTSYSDIDKYYCVVDNTLVVRFVNSGRPPTPPTYTEYTIGYYYLQGAGTTGRIQVRSLRNRTSTASLKLNYDFYYMILKEVP